MNHAQPTMNPGNKLKKWPGIMAALLVAAVFFEGAGFSFSFMGMRIRSVQVLEIAFLAFLGVSWLAGKWRWRKSPLDHWLIAYLAVNLIAVANSSWKTRSLKIFLLLVSLALLYWLVFQLLASARGFRLAFHAFLLVGFLQVLFGLYQVAAGALNHYRGWTLPVGHLGTVHREFINSVWGRPYGTQVEPDFYGALCMVLALIFFALFFSAPNRERRWWLAGALVSLAGLYLSFVRTAWLVFLPAFALLVVLRKRWPFLKADWKRFALVVASIIGLHLAAVQAIAPLRAIHDFRFASVTAPPRERALPGPGLQAGREKLPGPGVRAGKETLPGSDQHFGGENIRFDFMKIAWRAFLRSPILGNGPGSFAYSKWESRWGAAATREKIRNNAFASTDPNLPLTVLEDTGLIGFFLFMVIAFRFCRLNFTGIAVTGAPPAPQALALFVGLLALFATYFMTSGFWLPLTWVLLGLNIAALKPSPGSGGGDARRIVEEGGHAHRV